MHFKNLQSLPPGVRHPFCDNNYDGLFRDYAGLFVPDNNIDATGGLFYSYIRGMNDRQRGLLTFLALLFKRNMLMKTVAVKEDMYDQLRLH